MAERHKDDYSDMLDMPHHISRKHPQMSMRDRAAQFSPFAALTGHSEAIKETERLTDKRPELTEDRKALLDRKLYEIMHEEGEVNEVTVTYFVEDERKEGGEMKSKSGRIARLDGYRREIVMEDGTEVPIRDISDIRAEIRTL